MKKRVDELVASMKAFGRKEYRKNELLSEMFALQQEIVNLTFNDEHAANAGLRIVDVEKHLEQLNSERGNIADDEFKKFEEESKVFCNLIRAEISGSKGEEMAFQGLQNIRSRNIVLKNVELGEGTCRTEIDALVITPGALTIVEAKNTGKNIFIDEQGDYYRTGKFLKWDCNIKEKMKMKEELIRKALATAGIESIRIESVVVFTNNKIEVENRYSGLRTCFISQLAYTVDRIANEKPFANEQMEVIENTIKAAENKNAYPFEFDVEQYKHDFATVLAALEEATAKEKEEHEEKKMVKVNSTKARKTGRKRINKFFASKNVRNVASAVISEVATMVAVAVVRKIIKL